MTLFWQEIAKTTKKWQQNTLVSPTTFHRNDNKSTNMQSIHDFNIPETFPIIPPNNTTTAEMSEKSIKCQIKWVVGYRM